ncbi:group I truncated hemoglobin [Cryptosporangium aurantiacum]|uniref:Group 1 truncated hemoglobin n=1 Tax=Cryptosporangium aurantiacum TaxID=134849 RepID=A0A1M7MNJ8_9ACTN|nr:group 1 truncated hemoglobin [Cryptosporangium aurantiacum]SHM92472.1 hemoglobin [Cryptosporangium aurantiacum]
MSTEAAPETIFERIGGEPAVAAVVDLFYAKVIADPSLAPYFDGVDLEQLKEHQRLFVGQALGAERPYPGRALSVAHAGLGITPAAFAAVVGHLAASLAEAGVDDETISQIAAVLVPLEPEVVSL